MSSGVSYYSDSDSDRWDESCYGERSDIESGPEDEYDNYSASVEDFRTVQRESLIYYSSESDIYCKDENHTDRNRTKERLETKSKERVKDKDKPFYVPWKPHFFEHDVRVVDEEEEKEEEIVRRYRNHRKTEKVLDCWTHDMYIEEEQQPKSKKELIDCYGYDIRLDSTTSFGNRSCKSYNCDQRSVYFKQTNRGNTGKNNGKFSHPREEINIAGLTVPKNNKLEASKKKGSADVKPLFSEQSEGNCDDIDIVVVNKLSLESSEKISQGSTKEFKDCAVSTNCMGRQCSRSVSPPKIIVINNLNSIGQSPHSLKGHKGTNISEDMKDSKTVTASQNMKSTSAQVYKTFERKISVNGDGNDCTSNNVNRNKFKLIGSVPDLPESCNCSNYQNRRIFPGAGDRQDYLANYYSTGTRENFLFPEPPDLSVSHLMPCTSPHQYYMNPFHHQGFNSALQWGYFSQPYFQTSSGLTFVKQTCTRHWSNALHQNHLLASHQQIDMDRYYLARDNAGAGNQDSGEKIIVTLLDTLCEKKATSCHRYSHVRNILHMRHSDKGHD